MNILYVIPMDIYTEPWAVRALKISEKLVCFGHHVTLFYFWNQSKRGAAPVILRDPPPGPSIRSFPLWNVWDDTFSTRPFMALLGEFRALARDADIVHLQKALPWAALPAILSARLEGKPLHYDWDDNETAIAAEFAPTLLRAEISLYERLLPRLAATVSVSTSALRNSLVSRGFRAEMIADAPVGADLHVFNPRRRAEGLRQRLGVEGPVILYMGQIEWGSYVELLIDAVPRIVRKAGNVTILVVGGGEKLEMMRERARGVPEGEHVIFTGYVGREVVADYVAACDVAVACFPDNEITRCKSPLKIAEYMAAGKPVVASAVGDVPAMVGGAGLLAAPGDTDDLAQKIITLLGDAGMRKTMGEEGRRRAEAIYNWDTTARNIERAYEKALSRVGR